MLPAAGQQRPALPAVARIPSYTGHFSTKCFRSQHIVVGARPSQHGSTVTDRDGDSFWPWPGQRQHTRPRNIRPTLAPLLNFVATLSDVLSQCTALPGCAQHQTANITSCAGLHEPYRSLRLDRRCVVCKPPVNAFRQCSAGISIEKNRLPRAQQHHLLLRACVANGIGNVQTVDLNDSTNMCSLRMLMFVNCTFELRAMVEGVHTCGLLSHGVG